MDYEAVEPDGDSLSKWKSRNEFSFSELLDLTETEPLPNFVGLGWTMEPNKLKIFKGFSEPNTELIPKRFAIRDH